MKIGIFSFIYREDISVLMKLFEVNEKLKEMSSRNGFYFIDNLYIDGFCFNGSKLYLNFKGLVYLVISFIKFFRLLVNKVRCF